ncbi:hypothetical protein BDZ89DRAFT_1073455 [Hymenopellis radicata]|nr:hypothetical protein BDZ89DRAFT_1073455 [Hymenopellis radicata]
MVRPRRGTEDANRHDSSNAGTKLKRDVIKLTSQASFHTLSAPRRSVQPWSQARAVFMAN